MATLPAPAAHTCVRLLRFIIRLECADFAPRPKQSLCGRQEHGAHKGNENRSALKPQPIRALQQAALFLAAYRRRDVLSGSPNELHGYAGDGTLFARSSGFIFGFASFPCVHVCMFTGPFIRNTTLMPSRTPLPRSFFLPRHQQPQFFGTRWWKHFPLCRIWKVLEWIQIGGQWSTLNVLSYAEKTFPIPLLHH